MRLLERFILFGMLLLMSQFPLFVDQYDMRLQAHIEEVKVMTEKLRAVAEDTGKSLEGYISKFLTSSDSDIRAQGTFMKEVLERHETLTLFHVRLMSYNQVVRPLVFCFSCDLAIAMETLYGFHAGFVFTVPVLAWGAIGGVLGYLFVIVYRRKKKKNHEKTEKK